MRQEEEEKRHNRQGVKSNKGQARRSMPRSVLFWECLVQGEAAGNPRHGAGMWLRLRWRDVEEEEEEEEKEKGDQEERERKKEQGHELVGGTMTRFHIHSAYDLVSLYSFRLLCDDLNGEDYGF
ncbi:hypothetical protein E2C01_087262 [Portunus trituberculatus]|uniref:Uncharacterized protein n=1 Tax=Portunus trituberculatus TaxID=210409 RepID=A0A5B7JGU5_PORTR|nr:hypothetical protein [Portunus trituberculatus]